MIKGNNNSIDNFNKQKSIDIDKKTDQDTAKNHLIKQRSADMLRRKDNRGSKRLVD